MSPMMNKPLTAATAGAALIVLIGGCGGEPAEQVQTVDLSGLISVDRWNKKLPVKQEQFEAALAQTLQTRAPSNVTVLYDPVGHRYSARIRNPTDDRRSDPTPAPPGDGTPPPPDGGTPPPDGTRPPNPPDNPTKGQQAGGGPLRPQVRTPDLPPPEGAPPLPPQDQSPNPSPVKPDEPPPGRPDMDPGLSEIPCIWFGFWCRTSSAYDPGEVKRVIGDSFERVGIDPDKTRGAVPLATITLGEVRAVAQTSEGDGITTQVEPLAESAVIEEEQSATDEPAPVEPGAEEQAASPPDGTEPQAPPDGEAPATPSEGEAPPPAQEPSPAPAVPAPDPGSTP